MVVSLQHWYPKEAQAVFGIRATAVYSKKKNPT